MNIGIVGIHTGIGKTICSAIICECLGYDYWKPVQAGDLDQTDSMVVKNLVSNKNCHIHAERYILKTAASPHYAAELDNITISLNDFEIPQTTQPVLVETAGGIMSPLSDEALNINLITYLQLPVILVSNNYLGSINHTLLTYELLRQKKINILGIVFVGETNEASEKYILTYTGLKTLFIVPQFELINKETIKNFCDQIHLNI